MTPGTKHVLSVDTLALTQFLEHMPAYDLAQTIDEMVQERFCIVRAEWPLKVLGDGSYELRLRFRFPRITDGEEDVD